MKVWRYVIPTLALLAAAAVVLWINRPREIVEEPFEPRQSHQNYREALDRLEIADTAMARAWTEAYDRVMEEPAGVALPFSETVYMDPRDPDALGYWFPLTRGRRVVIELETEHDYYFADVFRLSDTGERDGEDGEPRLEVEELVASRPEEQDRVVLEARRNGFYLFRLQPELLRGGEFEITIIEEASLAFPVQGATEANIWSFFGDDRDGGARLHHGVDVFAARGTPVLAVSDSEVVRVGTRERGGKIVTLRDEQRGIMLYYAHLEDQLTTRGAEVSAGDVIGTVGNSGNAVTTPPHLHIGIYQGSWRRPVDPWGYFVDPPESTPASPSDDALYRIRRWIVPSEETTLVSRLPTASSGRPRPRNRNPFLEGAGDSFAGAEARQDPELQTPDVRRISVEAGTPLLVTGASAGLLRVKTLKGHVGFTAADGSVAQGRTVTVAEDRILRDFITGDAFARLDAGQGVTQLAETERGALVRLASGRVALLDPEPVGS